VHVHQQQQEQSYSFREKKENQSVRRPAIGPSTVFFWRRKKASIKTVGRVAGTSSGQSIDDFCLAVIKGRKATTDDGDFHYYCSQSLLHPLALAGQSTAAIGMWPGYIAIVPYLDEKKNLDQGYIPTVYDLVYMIYTNSGSRC